MGNRQMPQIIVIGESCVDVFVYCEAERLAPDLPIPILTTNQKVESPGMASNVFRNIKSKHPETSLLTNANWEKTTKTRFVHEASNHTFFRLDHSAPVNPIDLTDVDFKSELIVISDYNKGFLTENAIESICESHPNVFLDTKKILGEWARYAKYIKINDFEYRNSKKYITKELDEKIIHTAGKLGCFFQGENYPVKEQEVRDASGAGDSFMAALVVEYLNSQDIISSINSANLAASEVVQHRGVGVI